MRCRVESWPNNRMSYTW